MTVSMIKLPPEKVERALVAASAAGLALICGMGFLLSPRPASAEDLRHATQVDQTIHQWVQTSSGLDDSLPLPAPQVHPAVVFTPEDSIFGYTWSHGEHWPPEPPPEDPLAQAATQAANLHLQGLVLNDPPSAMVNGKLVTLGTHIGLLTVSQIHADHVILSFKDTNFELRLRAPSGVDALRNQLNASRDPQAESDPNGKE